MHLFAREAGGLGTLNRRVRVQRGAEQLHRLRAVVLAIEGLETADIQRMLARGCGFVQSWVCARRNHGLDAIARTPHPSRQPRLFARRHDELRARPNEGPTPADGVCTLPGIDVQRIIRDEMGVEISLQSVYKILHNKGDSCLSPRPRHEQQDPAAQKEFQQECTPFFGTLREAAGTCGQRICVFFMEKAALASRVR